jgi:hypothetical protein
VHRCGAPAMRLVPVGATTTWGYIDMNNNGKIWLDLYVDAMMEKDPYKRLALVRKLRSVPRPGEGDDVVFDEVPLRRSSRGSRASSRSRQR